LRSYRRCSDTSGPRSDIIHHVAAFAAFRAQAGALDIEAKAKRRLADEYDAAKAAATPAYQARPGRGAPNCRRRGGKGPRHCPPRRMSLLNAFHQFANSRSDNAASCSKPTPSENCLAADAEKRRVYALADEADDADINTAEAACDAAYDVVEGIADMILATPPKTFCIIGRTT
jgi:hypothetical protein